MSPSALVGCMRVDSVHLLGTVPTLISNVEIGTLDVTILNHYEPQGYHLTYFSILVESINVPTISTGWYTECTRGVQCVLPDGCT